MPPKKREEKTIERYLVVSGSNTVQWVLHLSSWDRPLAYGWSDGSVTWKKD